MITWLAYSLKVSGTQHAHLTLSCSEYNWFFLYPGNKEQESAVPQSTVRNINPFCLGPVKQHPKWEFHTEHRIFDKNLEALEKSINRAVDFGCMRGWKNKEQIYVYMGKPTEKTRLEENTLAIWYQTEQNGSDVNRDPIFRKAFQDATFIWDFSNFNVMRFEKDFNVVSGRSGGRSFYVPFWTALHEDFFVENSAADEYVYDVLLFGLMTQRRTDMCNALSNLGVKTCCGVF